LSRLRALAKESLLYGISSLLSRFLNFLLVPFYTHVLTPAEELSMKQLHKEKLAKKDQMAELIRVSRDHDLQVAPQ